MVPFIFHILHGKESAMPLPQSGDHLVSACTGYQHHGLYLVNHQVINYLGFSTGNRYRR